MIHTHTIGTQPAHFGYAIFRIVTAHIVHSISAGGRQLGVVLLMGSCKYILLDEANATCNGLNGMVPEMLHQPSIDNLAHISHGVDAVAVKLYYVPRMFVIGRENNMGPPCKVR